MRPVLIVSRRLVEAPFLAILLLLVGCSSTSASFNLLDGLPIPQGAYEVKKLRLQGSEKNQQLFFMIERPFPNTEVLELYNAHFKNSGWVRCESSSTKTWDWFEDRSSKPEQFVHRTSSYWVSPDRSTSALISGRYYSSALTKNAAPDNKTQRWAVLVQKDVNAVEEAKRLSFTCR
jgi:hypothetical protein